MRGRPVSIKPPTLFCPTCAEELSFEKVRRREYLYYCEGCDAHYKLTERISLVGIRKRHEKPTPYTADEFEQSHEPRHEGKEVRWDRTNKR